MSSSSSSSSSSSTEIDPSDRYHPLISAKAKQETKKRDWAKSASIVAVVVGGLIAALALLCILGIFPSDLLGPPPLGTGITLVAGATILLPAAYVLYHR